MKQSTRLIVNSLAMFGRMAITVGIGLVVLRLQLLWLGEIDYGLILAMGATGSLLQFVSQALTTSVQRHFAYEIGRDDRQQLTRVFSTAWMIFASVAMGLWVVGQMLTPLMMRLNIPADRLDAAWWVYQFSLLSLVAAVLATPFQAIIVAHQRLIVTATMGIVSMLLRLVAVLMLLVVPWDRMIAFTAMQLAGFVFVQSLFVAWCLWKYRESRPRPSQFDRSQIGRIVGIAGWSVLGDLSWRLRMQGGVILLTVFFGPAMNAPYGVAMKVVGYVMSFSQAIRLAVLPVIVGAEAKGNRTNVHRLALVAGKYTILLLSLAFIPIWIEADQVLDLWIRHVPAYTVIFVRLALIWVMTQAFFIGYRLALLSTGDIGWYTRQNLSISVATLIVAGLAFYAGMPPWVLPAVTIVAILALMLVALVGIGSQIELPPGRWLRETLSPTLAVLVPATVLAVLAHWMLPRTLWRIVAVGVAYGVAATPLIWRLGLADWEREQFLQVAQSGFSKLRGRG